MNFTNFLLFVIVPGALVLMALVEAYKALAPKRKVTAKPVIKRVEPIFTDLPVKQVNPRGATEKDVQTIPGQWFSSPDVTHLETPAFLRKAQA